MKTLVYNARKFEIPYLKAANNNLHKLSFIDKPLNKSTTKEAKDYNAISIFSADKADLETLEKLKKNGVKYITLRSTGYDNVNLDVAKALSIKVANVPAYSPYAIAEHTVALLLALNRNIITANNRVKNYNFKLDCLTGFDLNSKTVGIIGTGTIGSITAKIMNGFGCKLIGYDIVKNQDLIDNYKLKYLPLNELCKLSHIISLHIPLTKDTHHLINKNLINNMKSGVILINTARGAVVNTKDIIQGLNNKTIGAFGMDVYEYERSLFFKDHSTSIPDDKLFDKLNNMPNVLITGHQAFLTHEALTNIADTTIYNLNCWEAGKNSENELTTD